MTRLGGCLLPDDLYYEVENDVWVQVLPDGHVAVGLTSVGQALAGRLQSVRPKPTGLVAEIGRSLATFESVRYVGALRSPLTGTIFMSNPKVIEKPDVINDDPYGEGWIVKLTPSKLDSEIRLLQTRQEAIDVYDRKIAERKVLCFSATPHYTINALGLLCPGPVTTLSDNVKGVDAGSIIHLMADDPATTDDVKNWCSITGQALIDFREDGSILHFIVKKIK
ncbi:MAG: sulfurtransferase TusA family protein [Candidatus Bathyarchaeia archaeon]